LLRSSQADGLVAAIDAVDQMLANVAKAQALAVLEEINKELTIFAYRHGSLKRGQRSIYGRLIAALRDRHPRTVWAATRRRGGFWNFDVYQHLGDGAAFEAKRRCDAAVQGLREIIENKLADPDMASAHAFLGQLLDDVSAWEADFIEAARHHTVSIYHPDLSGAQGLWDECERKYGTGLPDYRGEVATAVETWFQHEEDLAERVERRIQGAWRSAFMQPLRKAAGEVLTEESKAA